MPMWKSYLPLSLWTSLGLDFNSASPKVSFNIMFNILSYLSLLLCLGLLSCCTTVALRLQLTRTWLTWHFPSGFSCRELNLSFPQVVLNLKQQSIPTLHYGGGIALPPPCLTAGTMFVEFCVWFTSDIMEPLSFKQFNFWLFSP